MFLLISLVILFFLFLGFFFSPLKIVWQGNSLQAEISLYFFNVSLFKGILYHKPLAFEAAFLKKRRAFTSQELLKKFFSLFSKKKIKTQSPTSAAVRARGKKKRILFFRAYKKRLKQNFTNNILGLIRKIVFSFKIQKLNILLSFEQTPYIGVIYRARLFLPLKYQKDIHISFFETFRYHLTTRVFVGKFLFSLFFWFLRMNFITFCYNNKK